MRSDHIPPLRPGAIQIATLRLGEVGTPVDELASLLSADELARADAFHFADDRRRSITVRAALRVLLGHHLAVGARDVALGVGPHGRPRLDGDAAGAIDFNLSHSNDIATLGFARDHRIGVDIERIRDDIDIERLAGRFFTPTERRMLSATGLDQLRTFFAIWTRKEACVKASGLGLIVAPETFAVDLEDREPVDLGDHGAWATRGVPVDPGFVAAVAFDGDPKQISTFDATTTILG
jgi:4'-phosphopantetheinyl transferase